MAILKPLVIIMAILIFVLLGVVVWRMAVLLGDGSAATDGTATERAAAAPFDFSLGLDPSCQITGATLSGTRLTVVTGPSATGANSACNRIHILDIADGALIGNVKP